MADRHKPLQDLKPTRAMFCTPTLPEIDKDEIPQELLNDKAMFCLVSPVNCY